MKAGRTITGIARDIYTQAVTPAKRAAQTKVVEMILPKPKEQKEPEETSERLGLPYRTLPNPRRRGRRL